MEFISALMKKDLDDLFSYNTPKIVKVRDRRLGKYIRYSLYENQLLNFIINFFLNNFYRYSLLLFYVCHFCIYLLYSNC